MDRPWSTSRLCIARGTHFADLDYRSIAEILHVEVGTVSAALAAAHRTVRKVLEEVHADG